MSGSEDERVGVPLLEPLSPSTTPEPQSSKKRKRVPETAATESKRSAKRKQSKKPKDITEEALDEELGVNHSIAHMDSQLLADHLAQRTKRFLSDLSTVELEDLHVSSTAIVDTTSFDKERNLENLPIFLGQFSASRRGTGKGQKKLSHANDAKGTPHTLIIAASGLRAADLTRAIRKFQTKESKVAKLFAKHIKMKEAVEMCQSTRMGIGVGTPQRIADLFEGGALNVDGLERILVDASHIDLKKRGILDMNETEPALIKLLSRKELKARYGLKDKKIELLFF